MSQDTSPSSPPDVPSDPAAPPAGAAPTDAASVAAGTAKGVLYSLIETLGVLVGDPDLPEHARSGYEGLLESAHELRARLEQD